MNYFWFSWVLCLLCVSVPHLSAQDGGVDRAALRARMALLRVRTAISPDRVVVVSGPQSEGNALLLEAVQEIRSGIDHVFGVSLPAGGQQIRIDLTVREDEQEDGVSTGAVQFSTERGLNGMLMHRVALPDYARAYLPEARDAVGYAILFAHAVRYRESGLPPRLPYWFWQGALQLLHADDVYRAVSHVESRWRMGAVPGLGTFLSEHQNERLPEADAALAGVLLYGLLSRPSDEGWSDALFHRMAGGEAVDVAWLRDRLGMDPDEWFDRWILSQRNTIRGIGAVTDGHLDALRGAVKVVPGMHGVPLRAGVVVGGALATLRGHQDAGWFAGAVRRRRQVLEGLAQGRPARYQEVARDFLAVLDGLVAGEDVDELEEKERWAQMGMALLARDVESAGGIWREEQ